MAKDNIAHRRSINRKKGGPQQFPRAKKSLGQNFLVDNTVVQRILRIISASEKEKILEIGPGHGVLTEGLLQSGCRLTAIEYDRELYQILVNKLNKYTNIILVEADILKFALSDHLPLDKVAGNLPYNISSQILIKLFDYHRDIGRAYFMLQKEMAERLCAPPGSKTYGIMSVYAAFYADTKIEFIIPPTAFRPRPKVESAIVSLIYRNETDARVEDIAFFRQMIRKAFNQRRKTLKNSLSEWYLPELAHRFPWHLRPEKLTLEEFIQLYLLLGEMRAENVRGAQ